MTKRPSLPILDILQYYSHPSQFVENLRHAFHNIGFFLLKHDLPPGVAEGMLEHSRHFFQQPLETKMATSYEDSPSFRGYMPLGVENTAGKLDVREQVEYAVEYPKSALQKWPYYNRLKGVNPWPSPTLQQSTLEYASHVGRIADCLRESLCLALQLDKDALSQWFQNPEEPNHWVVKLVSYPPNENESLQGVGPHTDTNFLTLVLQGGVGGLQAFSQGEWIDVPTDVPGVLVCNLGEQAELLSTGYFLATPHRVVANRSPTARISVPLFYNPALSTIIEPVELPESLPWDRPANDKEHWRRPNNAMLSTVGANTFKSLARSHPRVFQRHHPDWQVLPDGRIVPKEEEKYNS